jgi:DNA-binding response OmpR family regulator
MPENVDFPVSALAVGDFQLDRALLHEIFAAAGWRLHEAPDRRQALHLLERAPIHVVLVQSELPTWNWKKALYDLRRLAQPPQLVVASRTADDYLWAEVLNIGGFDVLPQPLERDETERVIAAARRHFNRPAARSASETIAPAVA